MASLIPYFWSHSHCGKVRFIAAPFGYGPRVAAETMARSLNLTIDEWQSNSVTSNKAQIKVTLNFGVAEPINEPRTSFRVWVDCLMWLRNKIPQEVLDYDLFLAENFFDTNHLLFNSISKSKINDITPLYSFNGHSPANHPKNRQKQEGHILVSFGGIETPYTKDIHRYTIPKAVLESLIFASRKFNDKKIICCMPLHIREQLQKNPSFSEIHFLSPHHEAFLSILKTASIYVVQPGLYGPFEAFENNVPTVFTTPFSYTQVCQARAYDKKNIAGHIPVWSLLNNEIGNLKGDIANEEENCFERIANWIENNINENSIHHFYDWAENVLKNKIIAVDMTIRRKQYITKCRSKDNNHLYKIQKVIL